MYSHYMLVRVIGDWLGLFVALIVIGWVVGRIMMRIITIRWGGGCLSEVVAVAIVITVAIVISVRVIAIVIHWWTFVFL